MELEQTQERFAKQGLNVAAVMHDTVAILDHFAKRKGIGYPMLSNVESGMARTFGIVNHNYAEGHELHGMPFPGTFIVDENGVVKAKYFETDHRERYTASNILVNHFKDSAGGAVSTMETDHLKLTASASDGEIRPGTRVALVLDIDLKPKMHVYAPGVEGGYKPIDWRVAPASELSVALEADYPESRMLRLEAIDETVPVYDGRFRITRDLLIGPRDKLKEYENGELTIEGSFRYQACDDKMCYPPETVPVKWTFNVGQHDAVSAPKELRHGKK